MVLVISVASLNFGPAAVASQEKTAPLDPGMSGGLVVDELGSEMRPFCSRPGQRRILVKYTQIVK